MIKRYESFFFIFISSIGMGTLITVVLSLPIALMLGDYNSSLTNFISGMCSTIITLFILSYKEGYRTHKFSFVKALACQIMVLVTQILLVLIIGHAIYLSGPTNWLSRFVLNIVNPNLINGKVMLENYRWIFMVIAFIFIYMPITILAEYLGNRKHKKDFSNN